MSEVATVRVDMSPPSLLGVVCVVATDGESSGGSAPLAGLDAALRPCARVKGFGPESEHVWIEAAFAVKLADQRGSHGDGDIDVPRGA